MNEQAKIDEAEYFYKRMKDGAPVHFRYHLSAFLSAARSALQYACAEATARAGGQAWYDSAVTTDPSVKFMKDRRDFNIHAAPVSTNIGIQIPEDTMVFVGEGVRVAIKDLQTGEERVFESVAPLPVTQPQAPAPATVTFTFAGWQGSGDVETVCRHYLDEIKRIVADGQARGFLTA